MAKKKENYVMVPESVIQEFRDKGMSASLKKFKEGKGDAAFNEGIKRFYPSAYEKETKVKTQKDIPRSRIRAGRRQAAKTRARDAATGKFVAEGGNPVRQIGNKKPVRSGVGKTSKNTSKGRTSANVPGEDIARGRVLGRVAATSPSAGFKQSPIVKTVQNYQERQRNKEKTPKSKDKVDHYGGKATTAAKVKSYYMRTKGKPDPIPHKVELWNSEDEREEDRITRNASKKKRKGVKGSRQMM